MKRYLRYAVMSLGLALAAGSLGGCSTNPATGANQLSLLSADQERQIGAEQHPVIVQQYGGTVEDRRITDMVDRLGVQMALAGERPEFNYRFTVLDSPVVNAFALPGGYVYVTRGLLALANSEAELGGVLGHEVGHITARHSSERYSQSVLANIGVLAVGILTGSQGLTQMASVGAQGIVQSYSRGQEHEADMLGIRYLARTNHSPLGMANFLQTLERDSALQARQVGQTPRDSVDIFATHPLTADRVSRSRAEAGNYQLADPIIGRGSYLETIDGMIYGDSPKNGFVQGRRFVHPVLRFEFSIPEGFRIGNQPDQVVGRSQNGAAFVFDQAPRRGAGPADHLRAWVGKFDLRNVERIRVNGLVAVTGWAKARMRSGPVDLRPVVITFDQQTFYRFLFISPTNQTRAVSAAFGRTTNSFKKLSPAQAAQIKPNRLRIVTVRRGDTVRSLAARFPFDDGFDEERFRVLNALPSGQPAVGSRVKIVVDR